jgi:hypothetical protein
VLGFQQGGDSPKLIARDAAALRPVGVDGVNLTQHGRSTTSPSRSRTRCCRVVRTATPLPAGAPRSDSVRFECGRQTAHLPGLAVWNLQESDPIR